MCIFFLPNSRILWSFSKSEDLGWLLGKFHGGSRLWGRVLVAGSRWFLAGSGFKELLQRTVARVPGGDGNWGCELAGFKGEKTWGEEGSR